MSSISVKSDKLVLLARENLFQNFDYFAQRNGIGGKHFSRLCEREVNHEGNELQYCDYFRLTRPVDLHPMGVNVDPFLSKICEAMTFIPMDASMSDKHHRTYVIENNDNDVSENDLVPLLTSFIPSPDGSGKTTPLPLPINKNKQRLLLIMRYWINRACNLAGRKLDDVPEIPERLLPKDNKTFTKFILRGNPGVGKTALLNYAFSTSASELYDNDVIWVRVDLNSLSAHNASLGLEINLYFKFLEVFCRNYYFSDTQNQRFGPEFKTKLRNHLTKCAGISHIANENGFEPAQLANIFIKVISILRDTCNYVDTDGKPVRFDVRQTHKENGLHTDDIYRFLSWELLRFIQQEYSMAYIFMFDGLDSVTIDDAQVPIFENWIKELTDVMSNEKKPYSSIYIESVAKVVLTFATTDLQKAWFL